MKKLLVLILAAAPFLASYSFAQVNDKLADPSVRDKVVSNLVVGIESDNEGLKRSCIELAGKHKITEAVDALITVLNGDNSEISKVSAAVALYDIGNPRGLKAVLTSAVMDKDNYVKSLCSSIYYQYYAGSTAK